MEIDSRVLTFFGLFLVQFAVVVGGVAWATWQIRQLWSRLNDIAEKDTNERREFKREVREDLKEMRDRLHEIDKIKATRGSKIVDPTIGRGRH